MRCPLCGYQFDEKAMSCHASCAFNTSCGVICCPNCGYQMIDEQKTRLAATLRCLLARHASTGLDSGALCPLSSMQPGQSAIVNEIVSPHYERAERLNILGLVKDARLTLEQKHPTFVLRIGFTQLSIEREVADDILVRVTL